MKKWLCILFCLMIVLFLPALVLANINWSWPEAWDQTKTTDEFAIDEFKQSPFLDQAVASGQLPSVEKRLPENPLVREPYQEIGQYGGTATVAATSPNAYCDITHLRIPNLFTCDPSVAKVLPDIAESYQLLDNSSRLVIYLRKGLKWSDGFPFTADDIIFWYQAEILDEDIVSWSKSFWEVDGKFPELKKIDDYTVEMKFAAPFRPTQGLLNYWTSQQSNFFQPAHFLQKYHKKYNPEVEQLAEEKGYDNWQDMYYDYIDIYPSQKYPEIPVLGPWVLKERSSTRRIYERNPYYYVVDPEGNQLPYIDRLEVRIVSDPEIAILDAMQGNLDFAGFILKPSDFAMYKQNEEKGDYRVFAYRSANSSEVTYAFNLNHPDEIKRKVFQDVRFRQAMSLGINRDEINQFVYQGFGTPGQVTVDPGCSYFQGEWMTSHAEYDPEQAKQLLDKIGLKRGADGFLRLPNGEQFVIDLSVPSGSETGTLGMDNVNELVAQYWNDLGVKTNFKMISRDLYFTRTGAGEHDVCAWHADRMKELRVYLPGLSSYELSGNLKFATEWASWHNYQQWLAGGEEGYEPASQGWEPPPAIKGYLKLNDSWYRAQTEEEYQRIAKEIFNFHAENLWLIGTVARALQPVIIQNKLRNVPEKLPFSDGTSFWRIARPDQWFFKN